MEYGSFSWFVELILKAGEVMINMEEKLCLNDSVGEAI